MDFYERRERYKIFSFFVPLFVSLDFQIIIPRTMNKTKLILYYSLKQQQHLKITERRTHGTGDSIYNRIHFTPRTRPRGGSGRVLRIFDSVFVERHRGEGSSGSVSSVSNGGGDFERARTRCGDFGRFIRPDGRDDVGKVER